ncbi:hypothetical protein Bhyg_03096 [Pseudolycoriella hygida]|uniref:Regulatory protein zeste n=1 Tax=Pseudolycoriella hygida TaxID=35572 RepID=A0A9Q0S8E9_9DIPT|nr:hypothetical protein Bhyg_03096 [Pseudolycoriella hygida]
MKSRVRSKMLTVIESGGTTQVTLTAVDQKIYNMYPHNLNHLHVNNQDIVGVTSVAEPSLNEMPGNSLVSEEAIEKSGTNPLFDDDLHDDDRAIMIEKIENSEHGDLPVNEEEQEDSAVNDAQSKALIDCLEQFVADSEVGSYIDDALWSVLESHLNTLGPSKDILEWKLHVNSLKLQIRRKAKQVIDNGGIPQHYLSDQEMRVYRMIPYLRFKHDSSTGSNCEDGDGFRMLNVVECTSSQMTGTAEPVASFIAATGEEVVSPMLQEAQIIDSPILDTADNDDFHFVEVFEDVEKIGFGQQQEENFLSVIIVPPAKSTKLSAFKTNREMRIVNLKNTGQSAPPNSQENDVATSLDKNVAKDFRRITDNQKERLIQLVQNKFLKTVGRFDGANGVGIKKDMWEQFANELNTLGPPKSVKQWKDCLDYIKGNAKKKLAVNRSDSNEFGRGSKILNRLEEKIVSVYGIENLDGQQGLGECGFDNDETVVRSDNRNRSGCKRNRNITEERDGPTASPNAVVNEMSQNENPLPSTHNQRVQSDSGANAAHVNESSQNENAAPTTRNQCVQSGRGQTGRIRNVTSPNGLSFGPNYSNG